MARIAVMNETPRPHMPVALHAMGDSTERINNQ